jgi:predicted nucleic acid-binding protein
VLPDALIAATAAEHALPLCTANIGDFKHIAEVGLKPFRP